MVVIDERLAVLDTLELKHGGHGSFDEGVCIMEAVSWIAGEEFSDHPQCVSPVISSFMRRWNDDLDDQGRQELKRLIPRLVGTANPALEDQRGWMCADWLIRVHTPAWLDLAGCTDAAQGLRGLSPLVDLASLDLSRPKIDEARKAGAAARDAARDAAWDAAGDAARAAARAAAWDALKPTETTLKASAVDLVERMCALSETA